MDQNNNMTQNNTLKYRVGKLEENYKSLDEKIDKIRTNHLPHIQTSIVSMKTRINVLTAVNIGAIILGIIASRLMS